jgi:hypothetical protein
LRAVAGLAVVVGLPVVADFRAALGARAGGVSGAGLAASGAAAGAGGA